MTMLDVWDYIKKESVERFPELERVAKEQFYRNYIMCLNMAKNAGYENKESLARMKRVIQKNILHILGSSLALGYKKMAIKSLFLNLSSRLEEYVAVV